MRQHTQNKYSAMLVQMAELYGIDVSSKSFAATPEIAQTLQDKIVENSDFLQMINIVGVSDIIGQKILGGVSGTVTKRTNTDIKDRAARNMVQLDDSQYQLHSTESDVGIPWVTLDAWAKYKDFWARYMRWVTRQIAIDRMMIGFHGTSVAVETDPVANPMLQDVNKGWKQLVREARPGQILAEGALAGRIRLGAGGDYTNLDHFVSDVKGGIPAHKRMGLVALCGEGLVSWQEGKYYSEQASKPTEKVHLNNQLVSGTYGGLPVYTPPTLGEHDLIITPFENLSIYFQETSWRRKLDENHKRNRQEDFNSRNEGYVVEDTEAFASIEDGNVEFVEE